MNTHTIDSLLSGDSEYESWFRAQVQEALDDDSPGIPHAQAMTELQKLIDDKQRFHNKVSASRAGLKDGSNARIDPQEWEKLREVKANFHVREKRKFRDIVPIPGFESMSRRFAKSKYHIAHYNKGRKCRLYLCGCMRCIRLGSRDIETGRTIKRTSFQKRDW